MNEDAQPSRIVLPPREPVPLDDQGLVAELARETSAGHPLFGRTVRAVARRIDTDDVLFEIDGMEMLYAVVHLTWASGRERNPVFPWTELVASWTDWTERRRAPDHEDYAAER